MKFLLRLCRKICSDGSNPNRRKPFKEESETLEEDRISALPDPLIHHILSLLPMHEAIRTTMLSKRWNNIWIYVPSLNFKLDEQYLRCAEFVSFVTKTLVLHRCSKIDKFSVIFLCKDVDYAAHMDIWIDFAMKRKVEVLDLSLLCWQRVWRYNGEQYKLPEQLFACSSVREMKLLACVVESIGSICWGSLKSLSIHYVKLTDDKLEKILSGSPVLGVLELCEIHCLHRLHITTTSLRKLVLRDCSPAFRYDHLEIWAPYLQSLSISGYHNCKIRLLNVSSLVDALLDFDSGTREEHRIVVWEILEKLHSIKNLTLGTWFIQALSLLGVTGLPSELLKCRRLTLRTDVMKWDLHGIAILLQILPYLEMLDIDMHVPTRHLIQSYNFSGKNYSTLQEWYSKCSLLHLKDIKIFGFQGQNVEYQLHLLQFLLKNARVLEKMTVYLGGGHDNPQCCGSQGLLLLTKILLGYPRSSPHAVVTFCESRYFSI